MARPELSIWVRRKLTPIETGSIRGHIAFVLGLMAVLLALGSVGNTQSKGMVQSRSVRKLDYNRSCCRLITWRCSAERILKCFRPSKSQEFGHESD